MKHTKGLQLTSSNFIAPTHQITCTTWDENYIIRGTYIPTSSSIKRIRRLFSNNTFQHDFMVNCQGTLMFVAITRPISF
jgi:hypothetical protein